MVLLLVPQLVRVGSVHRHVSLFTALCGEVTVLLSNGAPMVHGHQLVLLLLRGLRENGLMPAHHHASSNPIALVVVLIQVVILLLLLLLLLLLMVFSAQSML